MIESVASWFTPTILFCFLNLMIGTIFITSTFKTDKKQQPQVTRTPSLLHRVKSFNLSFPDPFCSVTNDLSDNNSPQLNRSPSLLQRVKSINLSFSRSEQPDPVPSIAQYAVPYEEQVHKVEDCKDMTPDPNSTPEISSRYEDRSNPYKQTINGIEVSHVTRSKSATCVETKPEKRAMMVKSASEKRMPVEEKEEERRPATMRETVSFGEDEAVDSKADDFINKFRNQLKLQRLDSIIRYKEILNRGVSR